MALILCWYKNILKLDGWMKARGAESALSYSGAELSGRTIGIVGLGHVGKALAGFCRAFGMRVLAYSRSPLKLDGVEALLMDEVPEVKGVKMLEPDPMSFF